MNEASDPKRNRFGQPTEEQDSFNVLPNELVTQIFWHLPKEAIILNRIRQVSKRLKSCVEDNEDLWKLTYEYKFHSAYKGNHSPDTWFQRYQQKSKLQRAWNHSKYHQLTLDGHFGCVCCVRFDKNRIFTCSEDKSIKIWDFKSGQCIRSYTGHTEAVWSVRYDKDILASAGGDKVIKLWDLNKHKVLRTLEGHRAECWCVDINVSLNRVVSGSVDSTVGIYDLETGVRLHLLTHHTSSVFGLQLYENSLVTGSKDGTAYLFDIRDPTKYVQQYASCGSPMFCLQMDTKKLVTGHGNGTVNVLDLMTSKTLHQSKHHTDSIWSLHFDEDHLVTGSADKTIRVQKWNNVDQKSEDMYGWTSIGTIFSVMLNEDKIMVGDSSGCVQVLDYNNEFSKKWGNGSGGKLRENKTPLPDNNISKFDEQGKLNYSVF